MADSKITALTSIGASTDPANDPLVLVDVSDTSMAATGTTKKVTLNQLLGASGTATLASATITGDLTVDTNTLYVNSSTNNVGLGTLTPSGASGRALEIYGGAGQSRIALKNDTTGSASTDGSQIALVGSQLVIQNREASEITFETNNSERYRLASDGVATWSNVGGVAGTAMTLNSTGLGVGTSPAFKLQVVGTSGSLVDFCGSGVAGLQTLVRLRTATGNTNGLLIQGNVSNDEMYINNFYNAALSFGTNNTERLRIDSSGNVGIGVTPSAWFASDRALEFREGWGSVSSSNGTGAMTIANNAYESAGGTWTYKNTNGAGRYEQLLGVHKWFTAPSGTAGNAITFTQAMTLDASGNLLVGKSVSLFSTVGVEASGTGFISATNSASTNASTNLSVYSTGAAAFRFYVGLGGTVYATNTTISAISDARLKENVQDIDVGLGAILALKPRKFDWKAGKGKNIKGDRGFIAQEFEQVFPQLVDEWKDEAPEGETPYKSVRQDLIPVLVKAIQELAARVQTLETR